MRHHLLVLSFLTSFGCLDYSFHDPDPGDAQNEDSDPLPPDSEPDSEPWESICDDPGREQGSVNVDEACEHEAEIGTFTPVLLWNNRDPGHIFTTPVVGNLTDDDGDGDVDLDDIPDIVVSNTDGRLSVVSGEDGAKQWDADLGGAAPATAAIGDLDGDGISEVVAASTGGIIVFEHDGTQKWRSQPPGLGNLPICGGPGIYDLDADGNPEVVLGNLILDGQTGVLLGKGEYGTGSGYGSGGYFGMATSSGVASFGVAADIDLDGQLEVVTGNALYRKDGSAVWYNEQNDGFVAVGNFDDDDFGEIVSTWVGNVSLIDDDGTLLWIENFTGDTIGPPTVADFDGDDKPEIGVAGHGVYVVVEGDGTLKWLNGTQDFSSGFTGSSVFDFEGDGKAEVVYADENDVWIYDGITGDVRLQETRHSNATCSEYPTIADVNNDGHAEIVFTSSYESEDVVGVSVIADEDNSWMPGRPIWNQHGYSITNVGDLGEIPANPSPNWLSYNNFRSGDMASSTGGAWTDALLEHAELCMDDCDEGLIQLVIRVGNAGVIDLPAGVVVSVYSMEGGQEVFLVSQETTQDVPSGETTYGMVFEFLPDEIPEGSLRVRVDDDNGISVIGECHEDNNVWETDEAICP